MLELGLWFNYSLIKQGNHPIWKLIKFKHQQNFFFLICDVFHKIVINYHIWPFNIAIQLFRNYNVFLLHHYLQS
jgi:hypothetical protein